MGLTRIDFFVKWKGSDEKAKNHERNMKKRDGARGRIALRWGEEALPCIERMSKVRTTAKAYFEEASATSNVFSDYQEACYRRLDIPIL